MLDEFQQSVVDHPGGPLLVLAGPGTGKTTTLVEAIVDRIERRGASPDSVLALTFCRKAAEQLRDRVTARLGRTMATTLSSTFHSFAYGLVRRYSPAELYAAPLRLLSAPEQDVVLQELLTDNPESVRWPDAAARRRRHPRLRARGAHGAVAGPRARARPRPAGRAGARREGPGVRGGGAVPRAVPRRPRRPERDRLPRPDRPRRDRGPGPPRRAARAVHATSSSTSTRTPTPARSRCSGRSPATAATSPSSATPTSRSTASAAPTCAASSTSPPRSRPRRRRPGRRWSRSAPPGASARGCCAPRARSPPPSRSTGSIPREQYAAFRSPEPADNAFGHGSVEVLTFDTARAETEHVADLLRRAHLEDGVGWSDMAVLVRSGRGVDPERCAGRSRRAGVPVEVASDETPLVREPAVLPLLGALAVVVDADVEDPTHDDFVGADRVEALLTSPLGGLDATDVRALTRALRARDRAAAARDLVRRAVLEPGSLDRPGRRARPPGAAAGRPRRAGPRGPRRRRHRRGGAVDAVGRLRLGTPAARRHPGGRPRGPAGPPRPRRASARCSSRPRGPRSRRGTPASASSSTPCARRRSLPTRWPTGACAARRSGCSPPTASKGLEWRLVVVAHVQEGSWPDLRRRDSLLQADRIGRRRACSRR